MKTINRAPAFRDELLSFADIRNYLAIEPLGVQTRMVRRIEPNGVEKAWLSDLARALKVSAGVLERRLNNARRLDELARG